MFGPLEKRQGEDDGTDPALYPCKANDAYIFFSMHMFIVESHMPPAF